METQECDLEVLEAGLESTEKVCSCCGSGASSARA